MADSSEEEAFESAESDPEESSSRERKNSLSTDTKEKSSTTNTSVNKSTDTEEKSELNLEPSAVTSGESQETEAVDGATTTEQSTDDTPSKAEKLPQTQAKENTEPAQEAGTGTGGWGWGSWGGIGSVISSSVATVSSSAQALSKGIESMVTSVEETVGVPPPQELAHDVPTEETLEKESEHETDKKVSDESGPSSQISPTAQIGGFLSGFASAVGATGIGIVSGGLDALEAIGRKTVDILSEGDTAGSHMRQAMAGGPTLSQLLREAKEEAERVKDEDGEEDGPSQDNQLNFSVLFDQYGGLVHLEALELLSKKCAAELKMALSAYSRDDLEALEETMKRLSDCFTTDEDSGENEEHSRVPLGDVVGLLGDVGEKVKVDKLIKASEDARGWLASGTTSSEDKNAVEEGNAPAAESGDVAVDEVEKLYNGGVRALAELCSLSIELLRRTAEISLLRSVIKLTVQEQAELLNKVSGIIVGEFDAIASLYTERMSKESSAKADAKITSLYLEATNSSSYVQGACQLTLPVLQLVAVQNSQNDE